MWQYDINGLILETRLFLTHMQNTVRVMYTLVDGADHVELGCGLGQFPSAGGTGQRTAPWPYEFRAIGDHYELALKTVRCRRCACMLRAGDATFILKGKRIDSVLYPVEEHRGYHAAATGGAGYYRVRLARGERAALIASTESFEAMEC